jgi:hypothetical protein
MTEQQRIRPIYLSFDGQNRRNSPNNGHAAARIANSGKNNENTLTKILVIGIFLSTCFSTQESGASRGIFMCVSIFERKSLKGVALPA